MRTNEAHGDHGTVLRADQAAVLIDPEGELSLLLPNYPEDGTVPPMVALLAAVALRPHDSEWVEEMMAWFEERARA